jgi:hypothetical protein
MADEYSAARYGLAFSYGKNRSFMDYEVITKPGLTDILNA